jgi:hypothetical protein
MMSRMKQIEDPSAVDAPVGCEGGRSPSALSTGQAPAMPAMVPATGTPATAPPKVGPLAPGQRWSVARKREVVLRLLRGENVELDTTFRRAAQRSRVSRKPGAVQLIMKGMSAKQRTSGG